MILSGSVPSHGNALAGCQRAAGSRDGKAASRPDPDQASKIKALRVLVKTGYAERSMYVRTYSKQNEVARMSVNLWKPEGKPIDSFTGFILTAALTFVAILVWSLTHGWVATGILSGALVANLSFYLGSTWGCDCQKTGKENNGPGHERPAGL